MSWYVVIGYQWETRFSGSVVRDAEEERQGEGSWVVKARRLDKVGPSNGQEALLEGALGYGPGRA